MSYHFGGIFTADEFQISNDIICKSIPNFIIDLSAIINEYYAEEIRLGMFLDCLDHYAIWHEAKLISTEPLIFHYLGWRNCCNNFIQVSPVHVLLDTINPH